ncbi:MAG: hypothetical protein NVS9B10_02930 [Nevskia sp.]
MLAALGGAMTLAVGFVALVYLIYGHTSARMAEALPGVSIVTGCFLVLALLGLLAGVLLRKRQPLHWAAQLLLFASLPFLWQTVLVHLRS